MSARLKIFVIVATAALSLGAVSVPPRQVPVALAAPQTLVQDETQRETTLAAFVVTFAQDPGGCGRSAAKLAGRPAAKPVGQPAAVLSPDCAFPVSL